MGRVSSFSRDKVYLLTDVSSNSNFDLEWMSNVEISYDEIKHLRMKEGGEGKQISGVMSGMEICHSSGVEMMKLFQVPGF